MVRALKYVAITVYLAGYVLAHSPDLELPQLKHEYSPVKKICASPCKPKDEDNG